MVKCIFCGNEIELSQEELVALEAQVAPDGIGAIDLLCDACNGTWEKVDDKWVEHHPDCQCDVCYYGADAALWLNNPSEY